MVQAGAEAPPEAALAPAGVEVSSSLGVYEKTRAERRRARTLQVLDVPDDGRRSRAALFQRDDVLDGQLPRVVLGRLELLGDLAEEHDAVAADDVEAQGHVAVDRRLRVVVGDDDAPLVRVLEDDVAELVEGPHDADEVAPVAQDDLRGVRA